MEEALRPGHESREYACYGAGSQSNRSEIEVSPGTYRQLLRLISCVADLKRIFATARQAIKLEITVIVGNHRLCVGYRRAN